MRARGVVPHEQVRHGRAQVRDLARKRRRHALHVRAPLRNRGTSSARFGDDAGVTDLLDAQRAAVEYEHVADLQIARKALLDAADRVVRIADDADEGLRFVGNRADVFEERRADFTA